MFKWNEKKLQPFFFAFCILWLYANCWGFLEIMQQIPVARWPADPGWSLKFLGNHTKWPHFNLGQHVFLHSCIRLWRRYWIFLACAQNSVSLTVSLHSVLCDCRLPLWPWKIRWSCISGWSLREVGIVVFACWWPVAGRGAISGHTSAGGITVSGPTDCCASHAWGIVWPSGISALLLCPGLSWRLLKLWFHYPHLDQTFIAGSSTPHLSVGKCYDSDKLEVMSSSVLRNSMTYV